MIHTNTPIDDFAHSIHPFRIDERPDDCWRLFSGWHQLSAASPKRHRVRRVVCLGTQILNKEGLIVSACATRRYVSPFFSQRVSGCVIWATSHAVGKVVNMYEHWHSLISLPPGAAVLFLLSQYDIISERQYSTFGRSGRTCTCSCAVRVLRGNNCRF